MLDTTKPIMLTEQDARLATEGSRVLERLLQTRNTIRLHANGDDANEIMLSPDIARVMQNVLERMGQGEAPAVIVLPPDTELTTSQAAQMVGVSRPFFIFLLDKGDLPFRKVGTHRRIRLQDVLAYKEMKSRRSAIMNEWVREAQEMNLWH